MATIKNVFETVYPIWSCIMTMLTATDLATFCYACEIQLKETQRNKHIPFLDQRLARAAAVGQKQDRQGGHHQHDRHDHPFVDYESQRANQILGHGQERHIDNFSIWIWIMADLSSSKLTAVDDKVEVIDNELDTINAPLLSLSRVWNGDGELRCDPSLDEVRIVRLHRERDRLRDTTMVTPMPAGKFKHMDSTTVDDSELGPPGSLLPADHEMVCCFMSVLEDQSATTVSYSDCGGIVGRPLSRSRNWMSYSIVDVTDERVETSVMYLSEDHFEMINVSVGIGGTEEPNGIEEWVSIHFKHGFGIEDANEAVLHVPITV